MYDVVDAAVEVKIDGQMSDESAMLSTAGFELDGIGIAYTEKCTVYRSRCYEGGEDSKYSVGDAGRVGYMYFS